jgi:hypothetical protein
MVPVTTNQLEFRKGWFWEKPPVQWGHNSPRTGEFTMIYMANDAGIYQSLTGNIDESMVFTSFPWPIYG